MSTAPLPPRSRLAASPALARLIEQHVRSKALPQGAHLSAQHLADLFGSSRTPVNQALRLLASRGLVEHAARRGFFVGPQAARSPAVPGEVPDDVLERAYQAVARDRLAGTLPGEITETALRARTGLTKAQLHALLGRILQEGWIERRAGYGWSFTEILTTGKALEESFRLRRVLEPASLLEPGYRLDPDVVAECRRTELAMLDGAYATMPVDALFDRGARFHEAIVAGSGNRFFLDTIRRVNRIRRLLSCTAMSDRRRYARQAEEHLQLLDLLDAGRMADAAQMLARHLEDVQAHYARLLPMQDAPPS